VDPIAIDLGIGDTIYFTILAEIENVFEEPEPWPEAIQASINRATAFCVDGRLIMRLEEWRGVVEGAAFSPHLKDRKYRALASALRSINDPLGRYIQRLGNLQFGNGGSSQDLAYPAQVRDVVEPLTGDRQWNLRTVLELLKPVADQASEDELGERASNVREACEQAMRNYDRALSLALAHLIGYARQDLAMEAL
jgi:hypothetical protein